MVQTAISTVNRCSALDKKQQKNDFIYATQLVATSFIFFTQNILSFFSPPFDGYQRGKHSKKRALILYIQREQ